MAEELTFEASMKRLEEIVTVLETGEATLDTLLSLYEEGAGLVKSCNRMLDTAEQTIVRLSKGEDGLPQESPFEADE
ncbi:MAG: exodeoxyribonuclease VII small subunit [Clostridiales bacterium]|nr:exodeoxyribonuclease VII small subunit [Clostridiales bacterium]